MPRLRNEHSALVLIDLQEKLAPAIDGADDIIANSTRLADYASELAVPIIVTEQYPAGLGRTLPDLREKLVTAQAAFFDKIAFSLWLEDGIRKHIETLAEQGRGSFVIAGTEAHVCVLQAALDLQQAGFRCALVADAVGSRIPQNKELALARARQAGIEIVTQEMIAFEWMERAGTEQFRKILPLLK